MLPNPTPTRGHVPGAAPADAAGDVAAAAAAADMAVEAVPPLAVRRQAGGGVLLLRGLRGVVEGLVVGLVRGVPAGRPGGLGRVLIFF